ncbi:hypothetical protein BY458DRAFT_440979 [Sporodiniella umbellata]|nr:hypothetical protein BY458DRAFT_440979 [Sporodiniella umbellata]
MPSPSHHQSPQQFEQTWHKESNKVLQEQTYNTNAYQYSGTAHGNAPESFNAYSPQPTLTANNNTGVENNTEVESIKNRSNAKNHPSKWKALIRVVLLVFAVGHLGFAAGASPYSGKGVPFDSKACFYYLFAVVRAFYLVK